MAEYALLRNGVIVGYTDYPDDPIHGPDLIAVKLPEGFDESRAADYVYLDGELVLDESIVLDRAKSARIADIKRQAQININALTWRLERAEERERLGLPGETVAEVLLEREAIRRASNRCEAQIQAAQDREAVAAVVFMVMPEDYAVPQRLSRLEFLQRLTEDELQAILAAAETSAALKAALLKWQAAEYILLTSPETVAGVQALEIAGLIAQGRAQEILAVDAA